MFYRQVLYWIIAALLLSSGLRAQDTAGRSPVASNSPAGTATTVLSDSLRARVDQWEHYARRHTSVLHVQTDKDVYISSSNILFTGYLLQDNPDTAVHVLYVALVDPASQRAVASDRFAIKQFVGSGSLFLPDTLPAGPYWFIAYTDAFLNGMAQAPFRKMIHLHSGEGHSFNLSVRPLNAPNLSTDSIRWVARITTQYGGLATGGQFTYSLTSAPIPGPGDAPSTSINLPPPGILLQSGKLTINAFGEVNLALPAADSARPITLTAHIKRDALSAYLWQPMPSNDKRWTVSYYPEGGRLVNGHLTRVGITITQADGKGIKAQGTLLEDGQPVGTFATDAYGLGEFQCVPDSDRTYTIRLADIPAGIRLQDRFPKVYPEGYTLSIPSGPIRDTLKIQVGATRPGKACMLLVYTDQAVYYASAFRLPSDEGIIRVPIDSSVRGMLNITLYDDKGAPVAERQAYVSGPALTVRVYADSTQYQTGSNITLHVKVTDSQGRGVPSVFSMASVLSGRVIPPREDSSMDLVALTQYKDRYHWTDIASDTLSLPGADRQADYGYVLYRNKPADRPLTLLLLGGGSFQTFSTDSIGRFQIPPSLLVTSQYNHTLLAIAEENDKDRYELRLFNRYDSVNAILARAWFYPPFGDPAGGSSTNIYESSGADDNLPAEAGVGNDKEFNSLKTLKTILIKAVNDHYSGDATCNDYVCPYTVLNCENHPYGRKPVIGETYMYADYYGGPLYQTIYRGCVSPRTPARFLKDIRAIRMAKDIYRPDAKGNNAPGLETPYNSTLFWTPLTATDNNGEATIRFYSQQLPGVFVNIIEGISTQGPISGQGSFKIVSRGD